MGKRDFLFDISVIIYTKNNASKLERCLSSLQRQSLKAERFEVLVVNDGSSDETSKVIERYTQLPSWRELRQNAIGLAYAYNRALSELKGEYILFIGDELTVHSDCLNVIKFGGK